MMQNRKERFIVQEKFMKEALKEAQKAYDKEEVPVGAVIVKERKDYFKRS